MHPVNIIVRYVMIIAIWIGMLLAMLEMSTRGTFEQGGSIAIAVMTVIAVAAISLALLDGTNGKGGSVHRTQTRTPMSKRKNNDSTFGEINAMSLLTPEDLAELRADLKQRLRTQILETDGGEVESFEALLSEQGQRKSGGR